MGDPKAFQNHHTDNESPIYEGVPVAEKYENGQTPAKNSSNK
jgi:hypothetical protein